jgi:hypothetical protein
LLPLTRRSKPNPPAFTLDGESDAIVGARLKIVKGIELEVPPPGGGFCTVIKGALNDKKRDAGFR